MLPNVVVEKTEGVGAQYMYRKGVMQSVKPAETMFGYTTFAHFVPPFKPEHTLILGYGGGSAADLMAKIWGSQIKITGVDVEPHDFTRKEYRMKTMDAKEYVWQETDSYIFKPKFDFILIDLWDGGKVCDFVFDVEFVVRLKELAIGLVCMNILAEDFAKCKSYYDYGFKFDRAVNIEGNLVIWWSVPEKKI